MKLIDADKYRNDLLQKLDNARRWKEKAIKANAEQKIIIRAEAAIDILTECLVCLKEQPIVDAVPVVRCLDCLLYDQSQLYIGINCLYCGLCTVTGSDMPEDGFCSYARRRDKER